MAFLSSLFAGAPLILNLSFLQDVKNRVSEVTLWVAAVFYGIPMIGEEPAVWIPAFAGMTDICGIDYFTVP